MDGTGGRRSGLLHLSVADFCDVIYADLCRGLDPEQRSALDEELILPLGMTRESLEAGRKAMLAAAIGG